MRFRTILGCNINFYVDQKLICNRLRADVIYISTDDSV